MKNVINRKLRDIINTLTLVAPVAITTIQNESYLAGNTAEWS